MDKNQAVIDYLIQCPQIKNNPLFFNFADAQDNNKQLLTIANDKATNKPYIDGSVLKKYTFTIVDYRSVVYQAIVKQEGYSNENVEEMFDVQGIIDWITEQDDNQNYPDFGADCVIEEVKAVTDNPNLNGVDSNTKPSLAKYSVSIQITYLDTTRKLWNKEGE
jgi:hypothetical protein